MDDKDHDKFAKELLEASLKRYRSGEPRAGLENRILANVRASDRVAQSRRWVWAWALAASAAVLILAVVVLRFASRPASRTATVSPTVQAVAPQAETPKVVAVAPPATRVPRNPAHRPQTTAAGFHRPEQFPTPSPVSDEEKLLLQYVNATPSSVLAVQSDQLRRGQNLAVPELTIAALDPIKPISESREEPKN